MASTFSSVPLSPSTQAFDIIAAQKELQALEQQIQDIATPIVLSANGTSFNTTGEILDAAKKVIHGKKIEDTKFTTLANKIQELSGRLDEALARATSGATLSSPFPSISGSSGQGPGLRPATASAAPPSCPSSRATAPPLAGLSAHPSPSNRFDPPPLSHSLPRASDDPHRTHLTAGASPMPSAYGASSYSSDGDIGVEFMENPSTSGGPSLARSFPIYPQAPMLFARPREPEVRERAANPHVAAPDSSAINYADLTNTQFLREKLKNLEEELTYTKYHKERIGKPEGILWKAITFFPRALSRDDTPTTEQTVSQMEINIKEITQDIEDIKAMILMDVANKAEKVKALILQQECIEIENDIKEKNITIDGKPLKLNALTYFTLHELKEGKKDTKTLEAKKTELEAHHKYLTQRLQAITLLSS